jgi:dipeptidase
VTLPSTYADYILDHPYPASVPAEPKSVGVRDVFRVMRDYYQNTSYDMTVGMAAGLSGIQFLLLSFHL